MGEKCNTPKGGGTRCTIQWGSQRPVKEGMEDSSTEGVRNSSIIQMELRSLLLWAGITFSLPSSSLWMVLLSRLFFEWCCFLRPHLGWGYCSPSSLSGGGAFHPPWLGWCCFPRILWSGGASCPPPFWMVMISLSLWVVLLFILLLWLDFPLPLRKVLSSSSSSGVMLTHPPHPPFFLDDTASLSSLVLFIEKWYLELYLYTERGGRQYPSPHKEERRKSSIIRKQEWRRQYTSKEEGKAAPIKGGKQRQQHSNRTNDIRTDLRDTCAWSGDARTLDFLLSFEKIVRGSLIFEVNSVHHSGSVKRISEVWLSPSFLMFELRSIGQVLICFWTFGNDKCHW